MNLIRKRCSRPACLAILALALAACGSDSPSPPSSPPTPPPFQAQVVVVDLGTHGGKTTLVSTQSGGWTRNDNAITSGAIVKGDNDADYKLTLSNGRWSAEYVAPDPVAVALGTSGDTASVQPLEDGSAELDGAPLASGQVWRAPNGSQYRFTMSSSGTWTAEFVAPDPVSVRLGTSGLVAQVRAVAHGRYQINGDPISSGQTWTAANGNVYRLELPAGGTWTAVYVPPAPVSVTLGDSGLNVMVQKLENGTFELDGKQLTSGQVVTAANGNEYRLFLQPGGTWTAQFVSPDPRAVELGQSGTLVWIEVREDRTYILDGQPLTSGQLRKIRNNNYRFRQAPDGRWTATYEPEMITVRLGLHGGTITLTRLENGSHQWNSNPISSGDTVTGPNNHQYRLTLGESGWQAQPLPMVITIVLPGGAGSILVSQFEDGTYSYEGEAIRSGGVVTVNGVSYVLTLTGTEGTATRQTVTPPDPVQPTPLPGSDTVDTLTTYVGVRPRLRDKDGSGSTKGTILEVNGKRYPLADLLPQGRIEVESTFVEAVRDKIRTSLETIERLISLFEPDLSTVLERLESEWDIVRNQLDSLFPSRRTSLLSANLPRARGGGSVDADETVDTINDVLDALGSLTDFEDALDDGIFSDVNLDQDEIDDVFSSTRSIESLALGSTTNTRFGAYSKRERSRVGGSLTFPSGTEGRGAFAYSPLDRARTADLPSRGQALYSGGTVAASARTDQGIYRGLIELSARFSNRQVTGLISGLEDSRGDAWFHNSTEVDRITVPTASLHARDGSFASASDARAYLDYVALSRIPSQTLTGDFKGQFLSTGTNADAAIGTWELRSGNSVLLTGAFGAEFASTEQPRLPPTTTPDDGEVSRTSLIAAPDGSGDIQLAARDADGDRIKLSATQLFEAGTAQVAGKRLFAIADEDVRQQLKVLNAFIAIDDNSTSVRDSLWNKANKALQDHVFGPTHASVLGRSYPSGRSLAVRDENAVEILEDVLAALDSADEFADALETNGVFDGVLGGASSLARYDFNKIYNSLDYEVRAEFGHTKYTRFGAWRKSEQAYAISTNRQSQPSREDPDVFAYSPLDQVAYGVNDRNFPANSRATYVGQTRAVDRESNDPIFYDGEVSVTVEWGSSPTGSSVFAVITDLAKTSNGEPYLHDGFDVREIVFSGMSTRTDSSRRLGFSRTSPSVRIRYESVVRRDANFTGKRSHEGKFVGLSLNGPVALIGVWELGDIKGAYGAESEP